MAVAAPWNTSPDVRLNVDIDVFWRRDQLDTGVCVCWFIAMCMCVCVCVCERERKRELIILFHIHVI